MLNLHLRGLVSIKCYTYSERYFLLSAENGMTVLLKSEQFVFELWNEICFYF